MAPGGSSLDVLVAHFHGQDERWEEADVERCSGVDLPDSRREPNSMSAWHPRELLMLGLGVP